MVRCFEWEAKVIHCEDIFEKLGLLKVADTAGLPRWIKRVRQCVCADVEAVIVLRLIDAYTPKNNRRMVPVAPHHAADVVDGEQLPRLRANVLPAGDFFKHQQADLIAAVEKMARLRIVRCAHNVAMQIVAENLRILSLNARSHRLADERKRLMAVESTQLNDHAVQAEAVVCEQSLAETDTAAVFVDQLTGTQKPDIHCVQVRPIEVPQLDLAEVRKQYGMERRVVVVPVPGIDRSAL